MNSTTYVHSGVRRAPVSSLSVHRPPLDGRARPGGLGQQVGHDAASAGTRVHAHLLLLLLSPQGVARAVVVGGGGQGSARALPLLQFAEGLRVLKLKCITLNQVLFMSKNKKQHVLPGR